MTGRPDIATSTVTIQLNHYGDSSGIRVVSRSELWAVLERTLFESREQLKNSEKAATVSNFGNCDVIQSRDT